MSTHELMTNKKLDKVGADRAAWNGWIFVLLSNPIRVVRVQASPD